MTLRLYGQTSIFGLAFFVCKSLVVIKRYRNREKFAILTIKPRSHFRILIYRMWAIGILSLRYLDILLHTPKQCRAAEVTKMYSNSTSCQVIEKGKNSLTQGATCN